MLDEHLASAVGSGLSRAGIEARTVHHLGRRGEEDRAHLQSGLDDGWVFVTHDRRVASQAYAADVHSGVVVVRDQEFGVGELVRLLRLIAERETMESVRGQVLYLKRSMLR